MLVALEPARRHRQIGCTHDASGPKVVADLRCVHGAVVNPQVIDDPTEHPRCEGLVQNGSLIMFTDPQINIFRGRQRGCWQFLGLHFFAVQVECDPGGSVKGCRQVQPFAFW